MYSQETPIYNGIIIGGICVCILIFIFLGVLLNMQRSFRLRTRKHYEKELISLEQETARIASDLHDDIGAILYAAKMKLDAVKYENEYSAQKGNEVMVMLIEVAEKVKLIAKTMVPSYLKERGLVYSINSFLTPLQMEGKVIIVFNPLILKEPEEKNAIHLYRIVQELVHNSLKHAQAKKLQIELIEKDHFLYLVVKDDGKGFVFNNLNHPEKGRGLYNIKNRVDYLGGVMHIITKPGKGCKWEIRVRI